MNAMHPGNGSVGAAMHRFMAELYPICRSITGDGARATLRKIGARIPLLIHEVPSGTPVFDWTVPREWNIRSAWIANARGERVVDFANHSLHVLNYSVPVKARMSLEELKPRLYTMADRPDWIPYRTSYYREHWGFCLSHRQMESMEPGEYEVAIDSSLEPGHLSYGECFLPGASEDEVLISTHICHPSMCNDNLSGIVVATELARRISERSGRRLSYRFVFVPGTIGAITWLSRNRTQADRVCHGVVLTGIGDAGPFHYKKSRQGDAVVDRAFAHVLRSKGLPHELREFSPYGYDERQYCSPGFDLPVGCLMRSVFGTYPEYHTSADNLDFVKAEKLEESLELCEAVLDLLDYDRKLVNRKPYCEPQLGKRGLYRSTGGEEIGTDNMAKLWILNLADGTRTLLDIAERSGMPFDVLRRSAAELLQTDLLGEKE